MSAPGSRLSCWLLGLAISSGCAWWLGGLSAQPAKPAQPVSSAAARVDEQKAGGRLFFPAVECVVCHSKGEQEGAVREDSLSDLTEAKVWQKDDKHRLAYTVLQGKRAQDMGKRLGIVVTEDRRCVACHGVYIEDKEVKDRSLNAKFKLEEGVGCAVCHGPYARWADRHHGLQAREEWQQKSRAEKETEAGMTDLWNPVRRTQVCASCHLGNTAEGKVVTHDMYVAGHPPLPSFELATFCQQMPMHWKLLRDKSPAVQKRLQYQPGELETLRLVLEGGVTAFREAMLLVATQADQCAAQAEMSNRLLDLAQFDCYACHHELRFPGWRLTRGPLGHPGRPALRPWPTALVRLGMYHASPRSTPEEQAQYRELTRAFEEKLKRLNTAATVQPFGQAAEVAAAAHDLVQWSNDLLQAMARRKYDRAAAARALRELTAGKEMVDFDSARQIAWAFAAIYAEVPDKPDTDPKIKELQQELQKTLQLALPAGQRTDLLRELDNTLRRVSQYSPTNFLTSLRQLHELLPSQQP